MSIEHLLAPETVAWLRQHPWWVGYGVAALVVLVWAILHFRAQGRRHAAEQASLQHVWERERQQEPEDLVRIEAESVRKVPRWTQGDA